MTTQKADHTNKRKWMDKWKLTDPATLKDLPDNPDQEDDGRKVLYGDFIKKARDPNLQSLALDLKKIPNKKFI
tara:strand:- start:473 stop:691 length:219 start_codon:yes stop_codon:yes gene_type:complete